MSSRNRHLLALALATSLFITLIAGIMLLKRPAKVSAPHAHLTSVPVSLAEFTPTPKAPIHPAPPPPKSKPVQPSAPPKTSKPPQPKQQPTPAQKPKTKKLPVAKPKPKAAPKPKVKHASKPQSVHKPVKPAKPVIPPQSKQPQQAKRSPSLPPKSKPASKPMSAPATQHAPHATPKADSEALQRIKQIYLSQLRQTIARLAQDTYPARARRQGQSGEVVLHFTLLPDGRIENLSLQSTSGFYLLDEAAKAVIEEEMNSRYKPFPPGLPKTPISITLPIRYQLQ